MQLPIIVTMNIWTLSNFLLSQQCINEHFFHEASGAPVQGFLCDLHLEVEALGRKRAHAHLTKSCPIVFGKVLS